MPSGSECGLLGTTSWQRPHGDETVTLYKVDCSGTVGWVGEASMVFGPDA